MEYAWPDFDILFIVPQADSYSTVYSQIGEALLQMVKPHLQMFCICNAAVFRCPRIPDSRSDHLDRVKVWCSSVNCHLFKGYYE